MRRRAPYYVLVTSYLISGLGTAMSALAVPWLVLTTTGSPARTGVVAFAGVAPYVTAQALAGPIVDRIGLRHSFVAGNALAALATGAVPAMYALHAFSIPALIAAVAVAGGIRGAADTANSALVPSAAAVAQVPLERAASITTSANRSALLFGAPLAGLLVSVTGSAAVVAMDAVTFAVAAGLVAAYMRGVGDTATVTGPAGIRAYGRDLAAGLRFLRGERLICGIMLMAAASNLLDQGYSEVMQPVWARQVVGSAGALGLMTGVFGLGSVVGNLIGAWLGPRLPRRLTYGLGYMLGGVTPFLTLAFVHSLVPVLALFFVAAVLGGPINSVIGATLYERIPEAMRARVLGVVRASAWIGIPFGALIGGYVTQASGVIHALVAFGTVYFVITLATFVFPTWRQLRRPPPPAIPTQHPANPDAVLAT